MITKRNLNPVKVLGFVWQPVLYALLVAVAAVLLRRIWGQAVALPFLPVGTVGAAVAIFVAFRNNASYARWWEGRTLWASIHSSSRVLARQLVASTHDATVAAGAAEERVEAVLAYRREMLLRIAALAHATRIHLRGEQGQDWSDATRLLDPQEAAELLRAENRPARLLLTLSERIKDGVRGQILGQFDPISLEPAVGALNSAITACERLKDTPTPRQYDYFTRLAVGAFSTLLPFGLLSIVPSRQNWLVVVLTAVVAGVFIILEVVGGVVEAPFAGTTTDVPLTYLSTEIERDLREQLGETTLPDRVRAVDGYLW